jgi:predicted acyltransferase
VLIVWFVSRRKQAQIQAHAETRKLLIEKFGSAQELATFLESKGGQQFIGGMQMQARNQLRFLPGGVIMTMLGLAFLGLTLMRKNFLVPAVIFLAIGIGLLISAAIAHKLARNENGPTIESGPSAQPLPHA